MVCVVHRVQWKKLISSDYDVISENTLGVNLVSRLHINP